MVDVLAALDEDADTMMPVEHRPVVSDFQRTRLARGKRFLQLDSGKSAEKFQLHPVQGVW
jgi:hypothetical protein